MKNKILPVVFFLTLAVSATANAALKDRLVPIVSGRVNIAADTFIVGTHDKYIATIVRDFNEEAAGDVGDTMRDMAALHGNKNLTLIEKIAFDKNAMKVSLLERYMAPSSDLQARLASEPVIGSDMQDTAPGTLGGALWEKVAGPQGLGRKILGDDPAPVALSVEDKKPVDGKRYAIVMKNQVGGMFLDKNSIQKTEKGCSVVIVEAFGHDAELHFGGLAMQYTHQPYVDAHHAVSTYEYSFAKKAHRLLRFTKFSPDGTVIYSISNPNITWITADMDPELPFALLALRASLPKNVAALLKDDLKAFDAQVKEGAAEPATPQAKKAAQ